jgi:hypothetical protein
MSFAKLEEIKCQCGETFEAELWNAINATEDPELKDALLCGEINIVRCPACGQMLYAEHFLLYHDPQNEMIAFVYPSTFADKREHWEKKMMDDFQSALVQMEDGEKINYEPVLLFGLDALTDIVRTEEEDLDEISILEYCAKELGLELIKLQPSLSRPLHIPRTLPRLKIKGAGLREEILAGIDVLLKYNDRLTCFSRMRHLIGHDKKWHLDERLIKK